MKSRYTDSQAIIQVMAGVAKDPSLLDDERYHFSIEDFTEEMHRIIFGSMYNLYQTGVKEFNSILIEDYLAEKPEKLAIFKTHHGDEYIEQLQAIANLSTFGYYYSRMKKMTLLRMYNELCGMDLNWLYDKDNILDAKKKQAQDEYLDNASLEQIADKINNKIEDVRLKYADGACDEESVAAGEDCLNILNKYKETPDVGIPMFGNLVNTVTRGARLGRIYLRSAPTGVGKSRTMIADACMFSCGTYYDVEKNQWIDIGSKAPTLYIGTEQELDELRTMIIAFISGVNEEKILYGNYETDEWERCTKAIEILNNSPLYLKVIPDFCLKDIENTIKREIRERKISYFCFDYIHSTLKILGEITSATGVKGLREDNILFMLSAKLKELCVKYNVFIITATQLNGSYTDAEVLDQNSLRGAKAIADKVDLGAIMVETNEKDIASLQNILEETGFEAPKIKISVYKNRGGKYKGIYLWCKENRGICRVEPLFATTYNYQLIDIDNILIKVKRPSAF